MARHRLSVRTLARALASDFAEGDLTPLRDRFGEHFAQVKISSDAFATRARNEKD